MRFFSVLRGWWGLDKASSWPLTRPLVSRCRLCPARLARSPEARSFIERLAWQPATLLPVGI